jgi:hypothetical protein
MKHALAISMAGVKAYALRPTLPQATGMRAAQASRMAALLVSAAALTAMSVVLGGGRAALPSLVVSAGRAQETRA